MEAAAGTQATTGLRRSRSGSRCPPSCSPRLVVSGIYSLALNTPSPQSAITLARGGPPFPQRTMGDLAGTPLSRSSRLAPLCTSLPLPLLSRGGFLGQGSLIQGSAGAPVGALREGPAGRRGQHHIPKAKGAQERLGATPAWACACVNPSRDGCLCVCMAMYACAWISTCLCVCEHVCERV